MRRRSGFTLVELTVALAIAAMLLAAIAGMLVMSHRQLGLIAQQSRSDWQYSVTNVIRRDFLTASKIYQSDGWVWLEGDFSTQGNSVGSNRIGYGVLPWIVEGQTALVRTSGNDVEPMAVGPDRLLIERLDSTGTPQPLSGEATAISRQLRLWLWQPGTESPALITDLVVY